MIGETQKFKIIKFNKRRGNIVLSRRALLETERKSLRETTLETLKEGQIVDGVDQEPHRLRCVHRSRRHRRPAPRHRHVVGPHQPPARDLPGRRRDQGEGAEVRPRDRARVARPQADSSPIRGSTRRCATRSACACSGKVVSLADYGAFVELEPGHRGPDPRLGDVVDQARQAPVEGRLDRRRGRGDRARRRRAATARSRSA